MSTNFYLTDGGTLPMSLTDPLGLAKFKEFIAVIRIFFNDDEGSGTRPIFLEQLENVKDIPSMVNTLYMFKDRSEIAIGDFEAVIKAINNALKMFNPRELDYLQASTTSDGKVIEINLWTPTTTELHTDDIVNETDVSAATDAVVSKEIKEVVSDINKNVAQERAEIEAIGDNPAPTATATKVDDSEWITPTRGTNAPTIVSNETQTQNPVNQSTTNQFGVFTDEDDEEVEVFDEFEGSRGMQQSIDDGNTDNDDSPVKQPDKKNRKKELLDRADLKLRDKGWSQLNRLVGKGDTSTVGFEDMVFYLNGGPRAMKQARKDHINGFDTDIMMKTTDAEINLEESCAKIVDKSIRALNVEDGAVFNKIRVNRTQLDDAIAKSKDQIAKQVKVNETSHAIIADLDNRMKIKETNFQKICENFVGKLEELESDLTKYKKKFDQLETKLGNIPQKTPNFDFAGETEDETKEKSGDDNKTRDRDPLPSPIPSTFNGFDEFGEPRPDPNSEKVIPYGSRVILKSGVMKSIQAYIMNVTQFEGRNLYHAQTGGQTNIYVRLEEILSVEKEGDRNMFKHGYDPTRSMEIFHAYINRIKSTPASTPTRKTQSTPHKSPRFASGTKLSADGSSNQRRYQFGAVNPHDVDNDDMDDNFYRNRPLAEYEYIYPSGTAPKRVAEEKVEAIHDSLRVNLSEETKIQPFYEDLRRRLKSQNIPLREWSSLKPEVDILDIPEDQCSNYASAKIVMSRALFNLLDANKETLITDMYMKGELHMYSTSSDGFGFVKFMVSQAHPNFRHELSQPSIAATLEPPKFPDTVTLYDFCRDVQEYVSEGRAPNHFTPLAAAQFVAETLRTDTRFNKGRIALEQEIATINNSTGFVPDRLTITRLPRLILAAYDPIMRRELSKPKRAGASFNATRVEFPSPNEINAHVNQFQADLDLTVNRMNTRSGNTRDREQSASRYQKSPGGNQRYSKGGQQQQRDDIPKSPYTPRFQDKRSNNRDTPGANIPFVQCGACGGPGHEEDVCNLKSKFIRLNEWYSMLSPAKRKEMSGELDKSARATHERYKKAYRSRLEVRKRVNTATMDTESRELLLCAYRGQINDLDYGTLDPDLVDDDEPFLYFDPDIETLTE